ncbi:MAG: hypothetical protein J4224_00045 [Candidatus Diapherotrites archaeon]|uniref:Class III signal peptide-containing protein n=1 Tax=Candidatus Iainarchaeum sp. TaxID=3101447 RepID=A0A8T4KYT7_9ARCH|nr:hypothetical protein [Candidatus Diapherotrites archaeon]
MKRKAQITVEFTIVLVLLFLVLGASLAIFSERNAALNASRAQLEAKNLAFNVARTINQVHLAGNGTETAVLLDDKGLGFDLNIAGNSVDVSFGGGTASAPLITPQIVSGTYAIGEFVDVRNNNGNIEFGEVQ